MATCCDDLAVRIIRNSFEKLGKSVDFLTDVEVRTKSEEAYKHIQKLGIDINTEGDRYLSEVYKIFGC